jgi:exo-1,4-beta-D-glucosaminidase
VKTERALASGWLIRAAAEVDDDGAAVSTPGFDTRGWIAASVPSTPMAALVADGGYPDLYLGANLETVDGDRFSGPWWYRTDFEISEEEAGRIARLELAGVNYSAEVWLNGGRLASAEDVFGAFRVHEIFVSGRLRTGTNTLAIAVHPPRPGDFTIGFVDWNPRPPDRNMGLWRPVSLHLTGDVSLDDVDVRTEVDPEALDRAEIAVSARIRNHTDHQIEATVHCRFETIKIAVDVFLGPNQEKTLTFSPAGYPELRIAAPRLWWPHTMGTPELYRLELTAEVGGRVSDSSETTFGIRTFGTYVNEEGHRGYTVNGEPILIRGGGWVDDLLLADTPERIAAQLAYVKQMHLNTIRLEGFWGSGQELYDAADREGILIMPGWSCQWEWEEYLGKQVDENYGGVLEEDEMDLVAASLADQIKYLRNHPSIFTWVLASDLLPHPDLERRYQTVLAELDPTRPPLNSCGWLESEVSGPSGVKMNGPYDWVPPRYWWEDREHGGAFGFNTETGPGPQPPPLESLVRMIPADHLWPIDEVWNFHCGRNEFNDMDRYVEALDRRYGPSGSAAEFSFKAQAANYEAIRPMFESFGANRPLTTGVIQWMLNSAWPETYWQLYDWYLLPNGAFYGTRAACQPLSLAYDYADRTVRAINDTRFSQTGLTAMIRAFDLGAKEIFTTTVELDLAPGSARTAASLADVISPTPVWFLDLRLADSAGTEVGRNFYWLSAKDDVLDYANSLWFVTPTATFADFTALDELPAVELEISAVRTDGPAGPEVRVDLHNPTGGLAFFTELGVRDPAGATIVPVLWDDNYVSILPGERRTLTARLPAGTAGEISTLSVRGWNSPHRELPIR